MATNYFGEVWKNVEFDFEYTNENRIEISNYGQLRSYNKQSNGNLLKTPLINGYPIIRLRFFAPKNEATSADLKGLQQQIFAMAREIKEMKLNSAGLEIIENAEKKLLRFRKQVSKKFALAAKQRGIHYHSLIHRLVATYFLPPPADGQTLIAHLDYEKLNNHVNNLKWMTPEENYKHQQNSPFVLKEKFERKNNQAKNRKTAKLTVTKVMLLKKLLNEGKPIKQLVKQFKITDTQILRIKRGENWANISAAS